MANLIDSEAHFQSRALEVGMSDGVRQALRDGGIRTMSHLAFAIGQPNQPLTNDEVGAFLRTLLSREATLQEVALIKRITFEAQTYLVAFLRQGVEQQDDTLPKKIPFAERQTRMDALKTRLTGVAIKGELEPAHVVLERACQMYDQNIIKYLEPSVCISRTYEIQGSKQTRELAFEKGTVVLKNQDEKLSTVTDSELKLHFAFTRRAIALEFARIMSFDQPNEWETFLVEALHRESPPGYNKPSLAQVIQCDRAAWARLASTVHSVKQLIDGRYPVGEALLVRADPNITLYLAPVAKPVQIERPKDFPRPGPYGQQSEKGKGKKGKERGKGKGKGGAPPMPRQLIGKWRKTPQGEPLCFAYNTVDGCPNSTTVKPGERCSRGCYLCMEPKCQAKHSLTEHKH